MRLHTRLVVLHAAGWDDLFLALSLVRSPKNRFYSSALTWLTYTPRPQLSTSAGSIILCISMFVQPYLLTNLKAYYRMPSYFIANGQANLAL